MKRLKMIFVIGRSAVMILKNKTQILGLIMVLLCVGGCALGPWNNPKFDKFDWASLEINYWVIVGEDSVEQRNFLLNDPEYIRKGISKMAIKDISGSTVPTSPQMHWNTSDGEKWRAHPVFEDRFGVTKKGDKLYYSYYVEMEDMALLDWLRQRCLEDAQKDYPQITLASVRLCSSENLKSAVRYGGSKIFHLPEPISEETRSRITNYNDRETINRANALKRFEHYDSEGRLKPKKVFNEEFEKELQEVRENYRKFLEMKKEMGL